MGPSDVSNGTFASSAYIFFPANARRRTMPARWDRSLFTEKRKMKTAAVFPLVTEVTLVSFSAPGHARTVRSARGRVYYIRGLDFPREYRHTCTVNTWAIQNKTRVRLMYVNRQTPNHANTYLFTGTRECVHLREHANAYTHVNTRTRECGCSRENANVDIHANTQMWIFTRRSFEWN